MDINCDTPRYFRDNVSGVEFKFFFNVSLMALMGDLLRAASEWVTGLLVGQQGLGLAYILVSYHIPLNTGIQSKALIPKTLLECLQKVKFYSLITSQVAC